MFEANNNFTILIWTLLMAPLIVVYVRRWTMPFYGMLLYIPLAGLITVYLDRHPIALQAIDFFRLLWLSADNSTKTEIFWHTEDFHDYLYCLRAAAFSADV